MYLYNHNIITIDNHDSGYLGMAVQISSFGTLPYLDPEGIQPKTDGTAEIYALFLPIYAKFELLKLVESTIQLHVKVHILA